MEKLLWINICLMVGELLERKILTSQEIEEIKQEILAINADLSVFVFNDEKHINTCYNDLDDKVYIRGDILPDIRYASNITRDLMSVRSVLAHEYYVIDHTDKNILQMLKQE